MIDLQQIDASWTLFLDRDGVINKEKEGSYIFHYGEFAFYEGNRDALKRCAEVFGHIVVVTNQRGVGKGMMTAAVPRSMFGQAAVRYDISWRVSGLRASRRI